MTMIDVHSQGRDTAEGFVDAVEEKGIRELLRDVIEAIDKLRLALTLQGAAYDLGDLNDLVVK